MSAPQLGLINEARNKQQEINAAFGEKIGPLRKNLKQLADKLNAAQAKLGTLRDETFRQGRNPVPATLEAIQTTQGQFDSLREEMDKLREEMAELVKKRIHDIAAVDDEITALGGNVSLLSADSL